MIRTDKTREFFDSAMDRMFRTVGFEGFDKEFVKQDLWYTKKAWSETQEAEFKKWMIDEGRSKMKWSKKTAEYEVAYFLLMWGWSTSTQ